MHFVPRLREWRSDIAPHGTSLADRPGADMSQIIENSVLLPPRRLNLVLFGLFRGSRASTRFHRTLWRGCVFGQQRTQEFGIRMANRRTTGATCSILCVAPRAEASCAGGWNLESLAALALPGCSRNCCSAWSRAISLTSGLFSLTTHICRAAGVLGAGVSSHAGIAPTVALRGSSSSRTATDLRPTKGD